MSTFTVPVEIGDFEGRRFITVVMTLGSGATYTSLPRNVLEALAVVSEEQANFIGRDGETVALDVAWIRIRLNGREHPAQVVFGANGSEPLLGSVALEGFGLTVDLEYQRLSSKPGYLLRAMVA